ncbi:flavoprotein [Ktedonobacter sp. SOSP1-52]|uniref:NAD(P)-binding domain-containing protein n=1 Tax=Ktedonobacter sp. SOSP1-52 TaxID=2778366 RepID=UPI0019153444|nr:NAD(P)-binding domain-containing protein [Ktedonobacter sp. SOSP1-52]GHO63640.1 flavoprotein [Ktedonobacter sp. SOSP1-52]
MSQSMVSEISPSLPVAIIGAGPVGLAAAAHLLRSGETPLLFEAGDTVGASVLRWGHVRLFSPWRYMLDKEAVSLLEETDWQAPDAEGYPTGRELVEQYLAPLSQVPALTPHLHLKTRVLAVTRLGYDKMKTPGREEAPFVLRVEHASGEEEDVLAKAVIDASGTYQQPNTLGAHGMPALGERALRQHIFYGIPDVLGKDRARYMGRRVLVVGSGHSAFNALLELDALAREEPATQLFWAIRRKEAGQLYGGGESDALAERGQLGARIRRLIESDQLRLVRNVQIQKLYKTEQGISLAGYEEELPPVDEIIATTGFRPDLSLVNELRLALDPAVESPAVLAPLIDPNVHSCGTVPPHGVDELTHPEANFYIVGMKSYGRAPTFLMLTGYEQVRSIVAALTGDWERARRVELELPETGVCSADNGGSCCASPAAEAQEVTESVGCCATQPAQVPLNLGVRQFSGKGLQVVAQGNCCG